MKSALHNLKPRRAGALLALAGILAASPALAQFDRPEDAQKYRKAVFTVMGTHFARIGAVVKGEAPYGPEVAADARIVAAMSHLPFAGFVPGSETGETRAKPEIWTDRARFDELAHKMQDAVDKLDEVAASGEEAALRPAFGEAGKACKACHDRFRNK